MNLQHFVIPAVVAGWLLPVSACAEAPAGQSRPSRPVEPSDSPVVAEVGDATITLDEVDARALLADAASFSGLKLNQALYESRSRTLDELVADRLIQIAADERGVSREEILEQEIRDQVEPVDDAAVEAWYEANRMRIGTRTLDQVREPIRSLLEQQRYEMALDEFVARMRETVPVRIALEPPRVDVPHAANDPKYGPDDAPVRIIEFSDFQ